MNWRTGKIKQKSIGKQANKKSTNRERFLRVKEEEENNND